VVSESALTRAVSKLRAALGDTNQHEHVQTIPRRGYSMVAPMTRPETEPCAATWLLRWGCRSLPLVVGSVVIGRAPDAAVQVAVPRVSRRHARIDVEPTRAILADLGSKNGTFVNGRRLDAPTRLLDGDEIRIGDQRLQLQRGLPVSAPTAQGQTKTRGENRAAAHHSGKLEELTRGVGRRQQRPLGESAPQRQGAEDATLVHPGVAVSKAEQVHGSLALGAAVVLDDDLVQHDQQVTPVAGGPSAHLDGLPTRRDPTGPRRPARQGIHGPPPPLLTRQPARVSLRVWGRRWSLPARPEQAQLYLGRRSNSMDDPTSLAAPRDARRPG
jgi:hypothetical protein